MTINQCIKNGARVLLTDEQVEVVGDLHFILGEKGITCVLAYELPTHFVPDPKIDGQWNTRFDAVFDTKDMRSIGTLASTAFLDLGTPRVMIIGPEYAYLTKDIRDRLDEVVEEHQDDVEDILSFFKSMGITLVDDNKEQRNGN